MATTTWWYYDSNGDKQGPVTGGQLKWLAKNGKIFPGTMIETETGKTALAKKVKGLTFFNPSETPPIENVIEPSSSDNEANNAEEKTDTLPVENVRPKLFVDVNVNFSELFAATTKAKTEAEKSDADAKVKVALLTMGGDINGTVYENLTRLQYAVTYDDPELIAQLVEMGANVNRKHDTGRTPLHDAVILGNFKAVAALIKHGANVKAIDDKRQIPLHLAVTGSINNASQVISILLKAGADIEAKDDGDASPLHYAILVDSIDIVAELLKAGANVNAKAGKATPLDIAIAQNKPEIAELLRKAGAKEQEEDVNEPIHRESGMTRLSQAVINNDPNAISQLVKKGADVEAKYEGGATVLHLAVIADRVESVIALLEAGADIETKNDNGLTALYIAVAKGNVEIVRTLLKAGADIGAVTPNGGTLLQFAESQNHNQVADLLRNTKMVFKAPKMADMTSKERLTKGARYIKQRTETIQQIQTLDAKKNNPNELSFSTFCNDPAGDVVWIGCLFAVAGVLFLGWHAFMYLGPGVVGLGEPIAIGYFLLIAGGIGFGTTISSHFTKWRANTLSNWDAEQEQATSELAELNSALAWYDKLPKAERDKFDAAVRAEEKRLEEERKKREQERLRRESICPQCNKEWALSTSWETVGTNNEFRTEMKREWVQTGRGLTDGFYHNVPIQKQTVVTTERKITKCCYCSFRREGASRENRREIR